MAEDIFGGSESGLAGLELLMQTLDDEGYTSRIAPPDAQYPSGSPLSGLDLAATGLQHAGYGTNRLSGLGGGVGAPTVPHNPQGFDWAKFLESYQAGVEPTPADIADAQEEYWDKEIGDAGERYDEKVEAGVIPGPSAPPPEIDYGAVREQEEPEQSTAGLVPWKNPHTSAPGAQWELVDPQKIIDWNNYWEGQDAGGGA